MPEIMRSVTFTEEEILEALERKHNIKMDRSNVNWEVGNPGILTVVLE